MERPEAFANIWLIFQTVGFILALDGTAITITSSEDSSSSTYNLSEGLKETQLNPASQNHGSNGTTLDLIRADLDFILPLMIEYPKCYWIWSYRLWLLEEGNKRLEPKVAKELWDQELVLAGKMLARDNRNFHGWGYRRRVTAELESSKLNGKSMVELEFIYTTKMIKASLGNFSAWHSRSKLIPRLLDERNSSDDERRQFLDDAIFTDAYPYAQSVWFYYQFLMTTLTNFVGHATITPRFAPEERSEYVTRQLVNLRDILDGAEDCKWVYSALLEYTMALCEMEERQPRDDEMEDCKTWLAELRKLDPLRAGKWHDLDSSLGSFCLE
ncbi:Type II geranyl-geranyltransferase subunit alpha [Hyphodiscus hymeniophilus]|uniref:Geranylgeranyl transferase type-2 subunit alpha n=1 Tax=Hyphodiscus hymeniophilus TaxID=353542 RepID=A0A9P6SL69_9HELO|nr:Type II geranyl-geranyltransferase subunit alpha [Hyphodiscus hymeniophilus]